MIHWLMQSTENNEEFMQVVASRVLLNHVEAAKFGWLSSTKRRQDWLIGRYTAKKLIQTLITKRHGRQVRLNQIVVGNHDSGEPYAICTAEEANCPLAISISHSHSHAFCTAVPNAEVALGADLEYAEPRSAAFVADYFTAEEQTLVRESPEGLQDMLVNGIWSAKEATLKALHKGLSVDTRCVSCSLIATEEPFEEWVPFEITIDSQRYTEPYPQLHGWWRVSGSFVMTMVTEKQLTARPLA